MYLMPIILTLYRVTKAFSEPQKPTSEASILPGESRVSRELSEYPHSIHVQQPLKRTSLRMRHHTKDVPTFIADTRDIF